MVRLSLEIEHFTEITTWCEETFGKALAYQPNLQSHIYGQGWTLYVGEFAKDIKVGSDDYVVVWKWPTVDLITDDPSWETLAALRWN